MKEKRRVLSHLMRDYTIETRRGKPLPPLLVLNLFAFGSAGLVLGARKCA